MIPAVVVLNNRTPMKKYLLIIEDEKLWQKFKDSNNKDINSEIMELIKKKTGGKKGNDH